LAFSWVRQGILPRWALRVSIPDPGDDVAFIRMEQNVNGPVDVPRSAVLERPVWVKAHAGSYAVWAFDRDRRPVASDVSSGATLALETDRPNVFHAGLSGGTLIPSGEPLQRGTTYFLLARPSAWTPFRERLVRKAERLSICDPAGEWIAYLVYVPTQPDPSVDRWFAECCRRQLIDPRPRLELISPTPRAVLPDGSSVVTAGKELLVAVCGGNWFEPRVEVVNEQEGTSSVWPVRVVGRQFLALPALPPGAFGIYLYEWDAASLRLLSVTADVPEPPSVVLATASAGGTELAAPLHGAEFTARWGGLLEGREMWRHIEIPEDVTVTLRWRFGDEAPEHVERTVDRLSFAAAISRCLTAGPSEASLDAGAFGRAEWHGERSPSQEARRSVRLPPALLNRVRWLCLICPSAPCGLHLPLGVAMPNGWQAGLEGVERRLVERFLAVPVWPVSRLPHARSVARELACRLLSES
jgi:hypothetical protein